MSSDDGGDDEPGKHSSSEISSTKASQIPPSSSTAAVASASSASSARQQAISKAEHYKKTIFYYQPPAKVKRFVKRYRTEICSSSSSILSTIVTFPLDFVKSRMQSFGTTFVGTINEAYKAEGVRGFWRGVAPPVLSVALVRTFSFSLYQNTKYVIDREMMKMFGKSPLAMANAPNSYPNIYTAGSFALSGALSGFVITSISCPFELTKLNEQLHGKVARDAQLAREAAIKNGTKFTQPAVSVKSAGAWHTARKLVRERGLAGLYSGYQLHLIRDTLGTAIYFSTYESAKQLLANARGKDPTSPSAVFIAGGLCGIVSWACIYPLDVAKTVYQKALLSSEAHKAKCPPVRFFSYQSYRGLGVSAWRSAFVNMIFFSNFEMMKKRINALDEE